MAKQNPAKMASPKETMAGFTSKTLLLALPLALPLAFWSSLRVQGLLPARLQAFLPLSSSHAPDTVYTEPSTNVVEGSCESHKYTTEIVSLDPLVIYINNFTTAQEAEDLIAAGESDFVDSFISRHTGNTKVSGRTSQSAPLPMSLPLVTCILSRARTFMGTMLQPHEPFSPPQLVRYYESQKYELHTDFWPQHQILKDTNILFNRVASFFVFLRDNCTQGETYFPLVDVLDKDAERGGNLEDRFQGKVTRGEMDGEKMGVKFRPIRGNAVFWVNMDEEGQGDRRLVHAGLPVGEGEKIGLNLWPRKFYGRVGD